MTSATTIKVPRELRDRIASLAAEQHVPMVQVLEQAIARFEREQFFARVHEDLVRLRDEDPDEWAAYRAESAEWEEATIADGLGSADPIA
ncbi:MAG: hypothetical protein ACJ73S_05940 [Mycobacteriales bacterium]